MINHVRTLLLNRDGGTVPVRDFPGAEYVPPGYRARTLPPHLVAAYQALFGTTSDMVYRYYRLRQLMQLLHSSELEEFVLAPDPRVTYLRDDSQFFDQVFGVQVVQLSGVPAPLYVLGTPQPSEAAGVLRTVWYVQGGNGSISATRQQPPADWTTGIATALAPTSMLGRPDSYLPNLMLGARPSPSDQPTDATTAPAPTSMLGRPSSYLPNVMPGIQPAPDVPPTPPAPVLSQSLALPGTGVSIRCGAPLAEWRLTLTARPVRSLGDVLAQLAGALSHGYAAQIFGENPAEPMLTFKNLYNQNLLMPYKYGGLLLAIAQRIGELPGAN